MIGGGDRAFGRGADKAEAARAPDGSRTSARGCTAGEAAAEPDPERRRIEPVRHRAPQHLAYRDRQLPFVGRRPSARRRMSLLREDGANSGMSRPVGSKVKQGGAAPLETGVAARIGKPCSHQMNTPRCGMLCQPLDCAPRLKVGGVRELVERGVGVGRRRSRCADRQSRRPGVRE